MGKAFYKAYIAYYTLNYGYLLSASHHCLRKTFHPIFYEVQELLNKKEEPGNPSKLSFEIIIGAILLLSIIVINIIRSCLAKKKNEEINENNQNILTN